jgi:hypothetical protein
VGTSCGTRPRRDLTATETGGPRWVVEDRARASGEDEGGTGVAGVDGVDDVQNGIVARVLVQNAEGVQASEAEGVERVQGAHESADLVLVRSSGAQGEPGVDVDAGVRVEVVPNIRHGVRAHADVAIQAAARVGDEFGEAKIVVYGLEGGVGRSEVAEPRDVVSPVNHARHMERGGRRGHEYDPRIRRALQRKVRAHGDGDPRRFGAEPREADCAGAYVGEAVRGIDGGVAWEKLDQNARHAVFVEEKAGVKGLDVEFVADLYGPGQEGEHPRGRGPGVFEVGGDFTADGLNFSKGHVRSGLGGAVCVKRLSEGFYFYLSLLFFRPALQIQRKGVVRLHQLDHATRGLDLFDFFGEGLHLPLLVRLHVHQGLAARV